MREVNKLYGEKGEDVKEKLSHLLTESVVILLCGLLPLVHTFKMESETVNLTHCCPYVELALPSNSKRQMLHKSTGVNTD